MRISSILSACAAVSVATAAFSSYAKPSNNVFSIDGEAQYFAGTNTYWIGFLTNNSDVDIVMTHLAASKLKVLRVWGFNDVTSTPSSGTVWYQSFINGSDPVINTGSDGLERLDYVVQSAEAHNISLIINFVNNWSDYGGMAAYVSYYGLSANTAWYTSTAAQAQYQKYIAAVVARYKTSKNIFAWELANEPRCSGCDTSVITSWVNTTSAYIKGLDPNHMVAIGDEGFGLSGGASGDYVYSSGEGESFHDNLALSTIDFGTYHLYPSSWGENDTWAQQWIQNHADVGTALGKPVILEEYGPTNHTVDLTWQQWVLSTQTAGDMYWQYGDTLSGGRRLMMGIRSIMGLLSLIL
ncbi:Mannan endo-1,4-beta-mannosidase [Lachnellula hyalina]|uniref:mannan endo-1,4-beta-mannosidase n=1 Tax=Lachnellula hyalina TaxID=1316788 RepID=A0A8H8TX55_9HELO|nr:Mannan endo-1,4-beta-mannosidase [Lachnellula hyalina]TVY23980.1 Mannan endo-1,4-beta-mannosidase [Lachnellula hyalina]